jgi:hypothetical protein
VYVWWYNKRREPTEKEAFLWLVVLVVVAAAAAVVAWCCVEYLFLLAARGVVIVVCVLLRAVVDRETSLDHPGSHDDYLTTLKGEVNEVSLPLLLIMYSKRITFSFISISRVNF